MVRALLAGTKTQTRRLVKKLEPPLNGVTAFPGRQGGWCLARPDGTWSSCKVVCHYGKPGDRLWVRETFCQKYDDNGMAVYNSEGNLDSSCCHFRADGVRVEAVDEDGFSEYRKDGSQRSPWTPSIHMPRRVSRIMLEITDIRAQRLHDITEEDAKAEGIQKAGDVCFAPICEGASGTLGIAVPSAAIAYSALWNQINGRGAWDANPWVWALTFKRITP